MIYLASPYSGTAWEQSKRFEAVQEYTVQLMRAGHVVFSPIVYCHELARAHNLPDDAAYWHQFNTGMLRLASQMIVFKLPGWEKSKGVAAEIKLAAELFIPITWVEPSFKDDLA